MVAGSVSAEKVVNVSASEAWKVYGSLKFDEVVKKALPQVFDQINVVEGDGGVGTVLHVFLQPGMGGPLKSYKEKFVVVDNEKRVKEAEAIEGGYLDLGFTLYRSRLEVIQNEKEDECTTRLTVEYELKEDAADNANLVSIEPFVAVMQVMADHLHGNKNNNDNNKN